MESLLDSIGALFNGLFSLAQGGFDGVNQITGLIIALISEIARLAQATEPSPDIRVA